ncbi:MAG: hypothetical protein HOD92_23565 [Deltaproteobacteria bacterium]|jgi:hypothetical protein|nr:hypothetical protein [Deltaproteobacteria bacterium]MBT4524962.1 hypothetical protein [Deltaproteobacteria bacterium]
MNDKINIEQQARKEYEQKVINLCFDNKSIDRFAPGLKMIFALDEPPFFVKIKQAKKDAS